MRSPKRGIYCAAVLGSALESAENEGPNLASTSTNPRVGEEGKTSHVGSIRISRFLDVFFSDLVADLRVQGETKRFLPEIVRSSPLPAVNRGRSKERQS